MAQAVGGTGSLPGRAQPSTAVRATGDARLPGRMRARGRARRLAVLAAVLAGSWLSTQPALAQTPRERAQQLVGEMTLEEKLAIVTPGGDALGAGGDARLGVPAQKFTDGPNGIGDGATGVTAFPSAITLGAAFDPSLAGRFGEALGEEAWAKGKDLIAAPTLNIQRTPLWGRAAESFGEDPFLMSALAVPEVRGIQSEGVIAQIKHFAGYNQETGRLGIPLLEPATDDIVSERWLQEIEFPAFKAAVQQGGAASVMCSYNQIDGTPSCQDGDTLETLKGWGLEGFVGPDAELAVRNVPQAFDAGVATPSSVLAEGRERQALELALAEGEVTEATLDQRVEEVLVADIRLGLLERGEPVAQPEASTAAHRELATEIADQGTVLLQNGVGRHLQPVLPLSSADHSIAVIGYDAGEHTQIEEGGSSSVVAATPVISPLQGIEQRAPEGTSVSYAQGTAGDVPLPTVPASVLTPSQGTGPGLFGLFYTGNAPKPKGKPVSSGVDQTLDFASAPDPLQPIPGTTARSARWAGTLTPPSTGEYRFSLAEAGWAVLRVDGKKIIAADTEGSNGAATGFPGSPIGSAQGTISLEAGKPVGIVVEYATDASISGAELHLGWQPPEASKIGEAVEAARKAEVAIVFANDVTGEGADRSSLELPGDQNELIEAVAAANPRTIVVLHTASAVLTPWHAKVAGIIEAWYPGQTSGEAIAKVLYGDVDPGGRLPVTFPASRTQGATAKGRARFPGVHNTPEYSEGLDVGYRWYQANDEKPLFPFGYGLSYTSWSLADLDVTPNGGDYDASVLVSNTGDRDGSQVVQLYVTYPPAAGEPPRQLKAFKKVFLKAHTSETVALELEPASFQIYDEETKSWTAVPGVYGVSVGTSSESLPLTATIEQP